MCPIDIFHVFPKLLVKEVDQLDVLRLKEMINAKTFARTFANYAAILFAGNSNAYDAYQAPALAISPSCYH